MPCKINQVEKTAQVSEVFPALKPHKHVNPFGLFMLNGSSRAMTMSYKYSLVVFKGSHYG